MPGNGLRQAFEFTVTLLATGSFYFIYNISKHIYKHRDPNYLPVELGGKIGFKYSMFRLLFPRILLDVFVFRGEFERRSYFRRMKRVSTIYRVGYFLGLAVLILLFLSL